MAQMESVRGAGNVLGPSQLEGIIGNPLGAEQKRL